MNIELPHVIWICFSSYWGRIGLKFNEPNVERAKYNFLPPKQRKKIQYKAKKKQKKTPNTPFKVHSFTNLFRRKKPNDALHITIQLPSSVQSVHVCINIPSSLLEQINLNTKCRKPIKWRICFSRFSLPPPYLPYLVDFLSANYLYLLHIY